MNRAIVMLLPLALLLPSSLAFNCNSLAGEDIGACNEVTSSNLSDTEKELLISEIINKNMHYADHSFIYEWNTKIDFDQAPEGVKVYNSGFIKDAWLRIIAVMPSVIENDVLSSGSGRIVSAFNYRVETPPDYNSGGYPDSSDGDCRREYRLTSNQYWLDNYANNEYIGSGRLADFNENSDINFNVKLKVQTQTEVEHWTWYSWCCARMDGACIRICHECRFSNTDNLVHEVNIEDNKLVKYYNPEIEPEFKLINEYYGTRHGRLDIDNFSSFSLNFDNSYYRKFNYFYSLNYSLRPYFVLNLKANRYDKESFDNINVENINNSYEFFVHNTSNCSLSIFTHFKSWKEECLFNDLLAKLKISTDKLVYSEDDLIKVNIIEPKGVDVTVSYGDKTITAKNNAEFRAKYPYNKITANFDEVKTQRVIHVKKEDSWDFALNMGVFSSIFYVFYLVVKKYFGILLQF